MNDSYEEVIDWMGSEDSGLPSQLKTRQYKNALKVRGSSEHLWKSDLQRWRMSVVDLAHRLIPRGIGGDCIEIGAGNGLAAAYLSGYGQVNSVYALDYAIGAVYDSMPAAQLAVPGVNLRKLRRVLGNFSSMPVSTFDHVLAFGALHNAPDLATAFQEVAKSLKPNGWLICSDLAVHPGTPNDLQESLAQSTVPNSLQRFGTEGIRFEDTSDFFRSVPEYVVAAHQAGLFAYAMVFDHQQRNLLKRPSLKRLRRDFGIGSYYPRGAAGRYDRLLMLCTKTPPHSWSDMLGDTRVRPIQRRMSLLLK